MLLSFLVCTMELDHLFAQKSFNKSSHYGCSFQTPTKCFSQTKMLYSKSYGTYRSTWVRVPLCNSPFLLPLTTIEIPYGTDTSHINWSLRLCIFVPGLEPPISEGTPSFLGAPLFLKEMK